MDTETDLYFAFGMNLHPGYMQDSEMIGPAQLHGYKLMMTRFAVIVESESDTVYGGLWRITPGMLAWLDRREGYPTLYDRKVVEVETATGTQQAIVYVPSTHMLETRERPSHAYLRDMLVGYYQFDLPPEAYYSFEVALDGKCQDDN